VIQEKDDNDKTTLYTYNTLNQITSVTDKKGITTSYTYDYRGKVLSESVPVIPAQAGIYEKTLHYSYDVA
jgi:YD repeat-containing protein